MAPSTFILAWCILFRSASSQKALRVGGVSGGATYGIALRGGYGADDSAAAVSFGSGADATAVASDARGAVISVKRQGEALISFSGLDAKLPATSIAGDFYMPSAFSTVSAGGVRQWSLWSLDTFDEGATAPQWTPNDRGFCGNPMDQFLGGHCRFGATQAMRKYTGLPPHTRVRVRARIHYIDKWEGDSVSLLVHGNPVWSQSHQWCPCFLKWMCEKYGLDTCGRNTPDRLSVKAEAIIAHSSDFLDLAFNSSLPFETDPCYTSWGVDDVSVELM